MSRPGSWARCGAFQCRITGSGSIHSTRRKSLAYSSGSLMTGNTAGPESAWRFANEWLSVMADESGSNPNLEKEQPSSSPSRSTHNTPSPPQFNLLVAEDNLPDVLLVREVIRTENLPLKVHVASDGE